MFPNPSGEHGSHRYPERIPEINGEPNGEPFRIAILIGTSPKGESFWRGSHCHHLGPTSLSVSLVFRDISSR